MSELTWEQLQEWRAALDVVGVDDVQRQIASLQRDVTQLVMAHAGSKDKPPTVEEYMGLVNLEEAATAEAGKRYLTNAEAIARQRATIGA